MSSNCKFAISCLRIMIVLEVLSWLAVTLFRMFRARLAYFKVLRVSMKSRSEGDTQAIISVRELPPKESWSNL